MTKEQARLIFHSITNLQTKLDALLNVFKNPPAELINNDNWGYSFDKTERETLMLSMLTLQQHVLEQKHNLSKDEAHKEANNATAEYYKWASAELSQLHDTLKRVRA